MPGDPTSTDQITTQQGKTLPYTHVDEELDLDALAHAIDPDRTMSPAELTKAVLEQSSAPEIGVGLHAWDRFRANWGIMLLAIVVTVVTLWSAGLTYAVLQIVGQEAGPNEHVPSKDDGEKTESSTVAETIRSLPASIEFTDMQPSSIETGENVRVSVVVKDRQGNPIQDQVTINFDIVPSEGIGYTRVASSDSGVASIVISPKATARSVRVTAWIDESVRTETTFQVMSRIESKSAEDMAPASIRLRAENTELSADGNDSTVLRVSVLDERGNPISRKLSVRLSVKPPGLGALSDTELEIAGEGSSEFTAGSRSGEVTVSARMGRLTADQSIALVRAVSYSAWVTRRQSHLFSTGSGNPASEPSDSNTLLYMLPPGTIIGVADTVSDNYLEVELEFWMPADAVALKDGRYEIVEVGGSIHWDEDPTNDTKLSSTGSALTKGAVGKEVVIVDKWPSPKLVRVKLKGWIHSEKAELDNPGK